MYIDGLPIQTLHKILWEHVFQKKTVRELANEHSLTRRRMGYLLRKHNSPIKSWKAVQKLKKVV